MPGRLKPADGRRGVRPGERGVALLMVLVLIALLGSVVADFQFNSRVDLQLALNARDELQAEYSAMSALRLRGLLLKNSAKLKGALGALQDSLGVPGEAQLPITQLLEMVPVECGLMSAVFRKATDSFADLPGPGDLDAEGGDLFPGECIATSKSEHSKIPITQLCRVAGGLSDLADLNPGNRNAGRSAAAMLYGMLSGRNMERHFQENDRNGVHAENPEELIGAIADWCDPDNDQAINRAADEGRPYDYLRNSYRPKNAPFDSVAELQLVHGIDDELYEMLKDMVSIYTEGSQIELATVDPQMLPMLLMTMTRPGVTPDLLVEGPGAQAMVLTLARIAEMRMLSMGFMTLTPQMLAGIVEETGLGQFIDSQLISQVFTSRPSTTWYTIEAQGRVGNASRRIKAVFQAVTGQFFYVRIE